MRAALVLGAILMASPAAATDLLAAPPPCVAPADVPASLSSADLDPAREAAAGAVPADLAPQRPVDLDVPLYLPPGGVGSGQQGSSPSTNELVQTGTPIGGVAIRGGKAVSVQVLGNEQLPQPGADTGCAR